MPMDLGNGGLENLRAVNAWVHLLNANMIGSNRTAFKGGRITFGGGDALVVNTVSVNSLPTQYAETTLRVSTTPVEFEQGQIRDTGITTNFAIQDLPNIVGTNFFVLREPRAIDGTISADSTRYDYFLSRDGEFHWAPGNVSYGNEVQSLSISGATGGTFALKFGDETTSALAFNAAAGTVQTALEGLPSIGTGNVTVSGSGTTGSPFVVTFVNALAQRNAPTLVFDRTNLTPKASVSTLVANTTSAFTLNTVNDPTNANGFVLVNTYGLVVIARDGTPVFSTTSDFSRTAPPVEREAPLVYNHKAPQNLAFSRYGATIFDGGTAGFGFTDDASQNAIPSRRRAERFQGGLEQSNTSVMTLIPELSMAQKTFTALAKSLTVFSQSLDESMGLIK